MRWFIFFHPRPSRTNSTLPSRPGSAPRHREAADCHEVAGSVDATVDATPLMTPHYGFGPVRTCIYVATRETGDWNPVISLLERAGAESGGAEQWGLKRREVPGFVLVHDYEKKCPHPWDTHRFQ